MNKQAIAGGLASWLLAAALQVSGWQNPYVAGVFAGIGATCLIYAISGSAIIPGWRIPLRQAAQRAYEALRNTEHGRMADSFQNEGPDGPLSYFAIAISREVPVYGKFPPSTRYEVIPEIEFRRCTFEHGGEALKRFQGDTPLYVDLTVTRLGLRKAIKRLKNASRPRAQ